MRKIPVARVLILAIIFVVGLLARGYFFTHARYVTGDAKDRYLPLAQSIATRGEFSVVPGTPDTFNQPIYPLALAPFLAHLKWAVALQMALELAVAAVLWQITKALGGSPAFAVCGLWASSIMPRWFSLLASEAITTLFATLLLWALVRARWMWAGVLAGLCVLTRGDMIGAVVLMFAAAFIVHKPALNPALLGTL